MTYYVLTRKNDGKIQYLNFIEGVAVWSTDFESAYGLEAEDACMHKHAMVDTNIELEAVDFKNCTRGQYWADLERQLAEMRKGVFCDYTREQRPGRND